MAKVAGSYQSVVRGVSEQVPQDRRPGQHFEQLNMISDPVRGLARRHGSMMQSEVLLGTWSATPWAAAIADTANYKTLTFFVDAVEYVLVYRTAARPANSAMPLCWCFNKNNKNFLAVSQQAGSAIINALNSGGVSAAVNVGKYLFLAGNDVIPNYTPNDRYNPAINSGFLVGWVRGGAYSRTYSMTLTRNDNTTFTVSYTTPGSAYPGILDTSDIPTSDPDYVKKVNDRRSAYDTAVTQWIASSAAAIQPENIAAQLRIALAVHAQSAQQGSHILIHYDQACKDISVNDGGDGSLFRAVGNTVTSPDLLTPIHLVSKVVKVQPKKANLDDAYYMEAYPRVPGQVGWQEVVWRESVGFRMTPVSVFCYATVTGTTLWIAQDAAGLQALAGGTHPALKPNAVGDDVSNPVPYFFGRKISYLGMFQDRLVIGSGAVLYFSKPGDYLNFWRASVLSVNDDDPIEMYALGSEDDVIVSSTTYDRNLMLFGKRKQYTVNGRIPLTPRAAGIVIMSSHENAVDAPPVNSGNLVFYAKYRNGVASMHQVQMGVLADNPESYEVSKQLDQYLVGKPAEIVAITSPNTVFLRTTSNRHELYTYAYLDSAAGQERLFDAWSRWAWDPSVGYLTGVCAHDGDLLAFTLREGYTTTGARGIWMVCDRFVMDSSLSPYPYADSLRLASNAVLTTGNHWLNKTNSMIFEKAIVAYDITDNRHLLGNLFTNIEGFREEVGGEVGYFRMWTGISYASYVTPTNPYVRDRNDKALVSGRLTLSRLQVSVADTGGMRATVFTATKSWDALDWNGRIAGRASNVIGKQPIVTGSVGVSIGKEIRECTYSLAARGWLPLTITAIEWSGQAFNNVRRV